MGEEYFLLDQSLRQHEFKIFALFRIHLSYMVLTSLLVKTTSHGW